MSSAMRHKVSSAAGSRSLAAPSTNSHRACASLSVDAKLVAVTDGASRPSAGVLADQVGDHAKRRIGREG